jgi:hypothetical protein
VSWWGEVTTGVNLIIEETWSYYAVASQGNQPSQERLLVFFLSYNSEAFSKFQVPAVRFPFKFIRINPFASEATKVTLQNVQLLRLLFKSLILLVRILVKVKVTLVQALRLCTGRTAHRGSRGIALLYRH